MGRCRGSGGRFTQKPQVSIKSQTGVMAKKLKTLKKGGNGGGLRGVQRGSGVEGRSWGDAGVLGGASRENPRSLSDLEGVGHEIWPYLAVKLHSVTKNVKNKKNINIKNVKTLKYKVQIAEG